MGVFSAMKGAFDGGLEIPHSNKKFYGYDAEEKSYDAEENCSRILGGHVQTYMESLQEEEPEEYEAKFSKFVAEGVEADGLEDLYKSVHKAIRESPAHVPTEKKKGGIRYTNSDGVACFINRSKRSLRQRRNRV